MGDVCKVQASGDGGHVESRLGAVTVEKQTARRSDPTRPSLHTRTETHCVR